MKKIREKEIKCEKCGIKLDKHDILFFRNVCGNCYWEAFHKWADNPSNFEDGKLRRTTKL